MRRLLWPILWLILFLPSLSAQPADSDDSRIDTILGRSSLSWGEAAWLVGRAVGAFDEEVTPEEAAQKAVAAGWGSSNLRFDEAIDLGAYCYLLSRAQKIPGGLMYSLFPGARYAFRELIYRRVIPGGLASDMPVSGQDAFSYLQNSQTWKDSRS